MDDKLSEKISINDLVEHYVKRYNLQPNQANRDSQVFQELYGKYNAQIGRILIKTRVGEKKLWDIIKPEKGIHKISIDDFEKYCFDSWAAYIIKNCEGGYDRIRLEKDIEHHKIHTYESYLAKKLEDDIAEHNKMIENDLFDRNADEADFSYFTEQEISQRGHEMMLEAIYGIFYESFDWKLLAFDLQNSIILDNGYNPPVTTSNQKSIERLKDYSNYIGKKKFPYLEIPKKKKT